MLNQSKLYLGRQICLPISFSLSLYELKNTCFFLLAAVVFGSSHATIGRKKIWWEAVQEVPIISKCKERNRVKTKNWEIPLINDFVSCLFLN